MSVIRFEHHSAPLASRWVFLGRLAVNTGFALIVLAIVLAVGMVGYRHTEGMDWLDAFLNASMLLGGMGPVSPIVTGAGKMFAGCYALVCGLVVVGVMGLVLAPVLHRILHGLHVQVE